MKKVVLILLLAATVAHGETYEWIDKEGTVHFTDSFGDIPEAYRQGARPLGIEQIENSGQKGWVRSDAGKDSPLPAEGEMGAAPPMEDMKRRMLGDEGTMALIRSLKDDPEMQAILSDPATMKAIQSGDIGALMNNPEFMKMLDNPRIKEIGKKMGAPGAGEK